MVSPARRGLAPEFGDSASNQPCLFREVPATRPSVNATSKSLDIFGPLRSNGEIAAISRGFHQGRVAAIPAPRGVVAQAAGLS
jgi:hypothetical protein